MIRTRTLPHLLLIALLVLGQAALTAHAAKHTAPEGSVCLICLTHLPFGSPAPLATLDPERPPAAPVAHVQTTPTAVGQPRRAPSARAPPAGPVSF